MKKFSYIAISLIVSIFLISCSQDKKQKVEPIRLVKTMVVQSSNQAIVREYPARVSAIQKADLSFEVPGKLIYFPIKEGEEVKKGQLLAGLDPRDYQYMYDQAHAKYEHSLAMFQRYKELLGTGAVARSDYDARKAKLDVDISALSMAKKSLQDTQIRAAD